MAATIALTGLGVDACWLLFSWLLVRSGRVRVTADLPTDGAILYLTFVPLLWVVGAVIGAVAALMGGASGGAILPGVIASLITGVAFMVANYAVYSETLAVTFAIRVESLQAAIEMTESWVAPVVLGASIAVAVAGAVSS